MSVLGTEATWADAVAADPALAAFDIADVDRCAAVVCALHGHACVETGFMGEWACDRCGNRVGDSLMGSHVPRVIRGHDCPQCSDGWLKADFWARLGVSPQGGGFLQQGGSR